MWTLPSATTWFRRMTEAALPGPSDGSGVLLPDVDNAQRDDVIREDDGGGASGAVDEGTEGRLPDVDNAQRDDVVPEDDGGGASGAVDGGCRAGNATIRRMTEAALPGPRTMGE